jgi:hypothetical protein
MTPKKFPYATKNVGHIFGRELNAKVVSIQNTKNCLIDLTLFLG